MRELPDWARDSPFLSVTRTSGELSVLCHEAALPSGIRAQRGLRCLGIRGPLEFSEIGILAALARPLAEAGISILALSTHDTDYLLVRAVDLAAAVRALAAAGHVVHGSDPAPPRRRA